MAASARIHRPWSFQVHPPSKETITLRTRSITASEEVRVYGHQLVKQRPATIAQILKIRKKPVPSVGVDADAPKDATRQPCQRAGPGYCLSI